MRVYSTVGIFLPQVLVDGVRQEQWKVNRNIGDFHTAWLSAEKKPRNKPEKNTTAYKGVQHGSHLKCQKQNTVEQNTFIATKIIKYTEIVSQIIFKNYPNVTIKHFDLYKMALFNKKKCEMEKIPPSNHCNITLFSIIYNPIYTIILE